MEGESPRRVAAHTRDRPLLFLGDLCMTHRPFCSRQLSVNYDRHLRVEALEDRRMLSGEPQLIDVNQNSLGSDPRYFTEVNGVIYFVANDGVAGSEIWKTNGTEAGTVLLKDIRTPLTGYGPRYLTNVGGT